jgi:hypothetical protein
LLEWVHTFTPEEIRVANRARATLRRVLKDKQKATPAHTEKIPDDRHVKKRTAFSDFVKARYDTGDFKGIKASDAAPLIAAEWKALSATEKKVRSSDSEP